MFVLPLVVTILAVLPPQPPVPGARLPATGAGSFAAPPAVLRREHLVLRGTHDAGPNPETAPIPRPWSDAWSDSFISVCGGSVCGPGCLMRHVIFAVEVARTPNSLEWKLGFVWVCACNFVSSTSTLETLLDADAGEKRWWEKNFSRKCTHEYAPLSLVHVRLKTPRTS